jgi:hypothetical protein
MSIIIPRYEIVSVIIAIVPHKNGKGNTYHRKHIILAEDIYLYKDPNVRSPEDYTKKFGEEYTLMHYTEWYILLVHWDGHGYFCLESSDLKFSIDSMTECALKSLIRPCPQTLIICSNSKSHRYIHRIGLGEPIVTLPRSINMLGSTVGKYTNAAAVFTHDGRGYYMRHSYGLIHVYVHHDGNVYYLNMFPESGILIWLHGDKIQYEPTKTLGALLWQLSSYIRTRFIYVPSYYNDIDIIQL